MSPSSSSPAGSSPHPADHHLRFHAPHLHLANVFGSDWFGQRAEVFARFFGTPTFLIAQSVIVAGWILINGLRVTHYDPYPFILLNLVFSTQAAYASPLILMASNRAAQRDKRRDDVEAQEVHLLYEINKQQLEILEALHGTGKGGAQ